MIIWWAEKRNISIYSVLSRSHSVYHFITTVQYKPSIGSSGTAHMYRLKSSEPDNTYCNNIKTINATNCSSDSLTFRWHVAYYLNEENDQRRRKHCVLAVVRRSQKIFAPPQTHFPGARDGQNLISWRWSLPSPTDPVWWRSMHAISIYIYMVTDPQTHKQIGPITIHCAAKLSA